MRTHTATLNYGKVDLAAVRVVSTYGDGMERALVFTVPRPLRHDAAIRATAAALRLDRIGDHEQGFVTEDGVFVSREKAAKIAFDNGQVDGLKGGLLSEDLW